MESNPVDALDFVARALESLGITYEVTGSVAGFYYGRERTTRDIDIVVDMATVEASSLAAALAPRYFLDERMVRDSALSGIMFNAIPNGAGPKIDFVPLSQDPYDRGQFARRAPADLGGARVVLIQGQDLVISKLRWAKASGSERQLADVRAILAAGVELDEDFEVWVEVLELEGVLEASRSARYDA